MKQPHWGQVLCKHNCRAVQAVHTLEMLGSHEGNCQPKHSKGSGQVCYGEAPSPWQWLSSFWVAGQQASKHVAEGNDSFETCMRALAKCISEKCPGGNSKGLTPQELWCLQVRLKTGTWTAQELHGINLTLSEFPPDYSLEQKIQDDDFIKIVAYNIPQNGKPRWWGNPMLPRIII